jgi:hypothetical protein
VIWLRRATDSIGACILGVVGVTIVLGTFVIMLGTPALVFIWLCQQVFG